MEHRTKNNIELETPEFDEMVSSILVEALNDDELLDRIKKHSENKK